jgi:hypothetical protein
MNAKEQILKELESRRQHYVDELIGRPQHDDEYRWLKGKHDECIDMSVYILHHVKDEDTEPVENNLVDIRKETINGIDYVRRDKIVELFSAVIEGLVHDAVAYGELYNYYCAGGLQELKKLFEVL